MNNTTNTPILDAEGTNNNIGFEWGTTNPVLSLLKTVISNNEQSYHIPREGGIKPPAVTFSSMNISTVSLAFNSGVLGPNGYIYLIPGASTRVYEIDILSQSFTAIGTTYGSSGTKWIGGALAPDGKIYCMGYTQGSVLEIDPVSKKTTEYPTLGYSYRGAICANNGKVYGMPATTTLGDVLEFDPITKKISYFGNVGSTTFWGGVLAPNGLIYSIPFTTHVYGIIDPNNRTIITKTTPDTGTTNSICKGGVLAPNGKIYCVPYNADSIIVINTLDNTSYIFGNKIVGQLPLGGSGKCSGGFLGSDGYIYMMGESYNTNGFSFVLRINWMYDIVELIELPPSITPGTTSNAYAGALLTPYGKGVGLPYSVDKVLFFDFNFPVNNNVCLSNVVNKF